MSDGMGRELAYLSSHATNRYFIPNWGTIYTDLQGISHKTRQKGIMIKTDVYRDGKKHSTKILAE